MTDDATAAVQRRVDVWCNFYTRGLPDAVAQQRREELAADVLDQIEWGAAHGIAARSTAREVAWRAIRGVPSDLLWRRSQLTAMAAVSVASRIFGGSLLAAANLIGVGLFALGIVAVIRDGTGLSADPSAMPTLVAALLIACGLVLVARGRTRWLGALWVATGAPVILTIGFRLLAEHTTVLFLATRSAPLWTVGQATAAVCVGVFYVAAAVWWMPDRRTVTVR